MPPFLEFALGVCEGKPALGVLPCLQADVLCLFFEDSPRRYVSRERMLLGTEGGRKGITYVPCGTSWPLSRFKQYLDAHPACRCVIIDTAERFKQMQDLAPTGRIYSDDYTFWGGLQSLAMARDIALILIHHDRKSFGTSQSVTLDTVSGTRAITGSADHIWLLNRNDETGISTLKVTGRDLEERSIEFQRNVAGRFFVVGASTTADEAREDNRQRAYRMHAQGKPYRDIGEALGVNASTVSRWLKADG